MSVQIGLAWVGRVIGRWILALVQQPVVGCIDDGLTVPRLTGGPVIAGRPSPTCCGDCPLGCRVPFGQQEHDADALWMATVSRSSGRGLC
jgi:hypothetical protein